MKKYNIEKKIEIVRLLVSCERTIFSETIMLSEQMLLTHERKLRTEMRMCTTVLCFKLIIYY